MRVVAVSQRVDEWPERNERRDALDQRVVIWLGVAGFLAVPVPNGLISGDGLRYWLDAVKPSATLLSGGNDLGEAPDRDQVERELLKFCKEKKLPVLGICRGMQMMAAFAGSILQPVVGHLRCRHRLAIDVSVAGEFPAEVNSFHNWGLTKCPDGYRALALSEPDGLIEAMRHQSLPWEGWAWHPEREQTFSEQELRRVKDLFGA